MLADSEATTIHPTIFLRTLLIVNSKQILKFKGMKRARKVTNIEQGNYYLHNTQPTFVLLVLKLKSLC